MQSCELGINWRTSAFRPRSGSSHPTQFFFLCSYHRRVPFLSCFRVKCSSLDVFCDVVVGILVWRYERSAGIVKRRVEAGAIVRDSITNILDYWKRFPVHVLLSMKLILQRNTFSATDAQKGRSNFAPP